MPENMTLEGLFPPGVIARSSWGDLPSLPQLWDAAPPGERLAIATAVPERQAEFLATRGLAREALVALGREPADIPIGPDRAPEWPDDIVGSLAHCEGARIAVVAEVGRIRGVGVDVEPAEPLPAETRELILHPAEMGDPIRERLTFAIKEAIFKTWWPAQQTWLDFLDALVHIEDDTWAAHVGPGVSPDMTGCGDGCHLAGKWAQIDGFLLASAWLLREPLTPGDEVNLPEPALVPSR